MTKKSIPAVLLSLFLPVQGFSAVSGSVSAGGQVVNVVPDSSKFNEYRDLKDGPYLYDFGVTSELSDGFLFELSGSNAGRADQRYRMWAGRHGHYSVDFEWDETPHRLSNKAKSPYENQGGGLLTAPATVPLATKSLTPTAAQLVANDSLTATYLRNYLKPLDLRNDREKASATFSLYPAEGLRLRLSASTEERDGNKVSYGPIGDRPPRSINIQLEEPIDYVTREMKLEADYQGKRSQTSLAYELSSFRNRIGAVTWQNIYVNPAVGSNEVWIDGRPVASFGRRPLPQDNLYRNVSLTHGVDLPNAGRLSASASYGVAQQDEALQAYSTNGVADPVGGLAWSNLSKLPRARAEAKHESKLLSLDYVVNPIPQAHLRAFGRYYGVSNKTPTSDWRYVTQDVTSAGGGVAYLNKRRNVPYQYGKQNYGLDGDYSIPFWRTTLGLGYEHERVDREHREADTAENIARVSARAKPLKWLSVRTKYQYGDRQAGTYEEASRGTYWYAPGEATASSSDAAFTFDNHPDTRRWDVTDRKRHQVDLTLAATPIESLDISLSHRYRKDDYDSGVKASQPLLNYAGALVVPAGDAQRFTPGDQVGLLKDTRQSVAVDASYAASKRVRLSFFGGREQSDTRQRGFEYNENNKSNPSAVDGAALGPWNRAAGQWMADITDTTYSFGVGAEVDIIPEKLALNTNYTHSIGKVAIDYSGMGAVSALTGAPLADNNEFGFRSPPVIRNDRYVIGTSLGYNVRKDITVNLGYMFDYFKQRDWQQEADTPQSESVDGTEEETRDTSRSTHWGNRLPNMGPYLAPSYEAHLVSLSMAYRF